MEAYLCREELWGVTIGPPADGDDEDQRRNRRAYAAIVMVLDDNQLMNMRGLVHANDFWETLRHLHVRDTMVLKITLTRWLYHTQLHPGESMERHLQVMRVMFVELDEKGMHFTKLHKSFMVLSSLDTSYDTLVTSLEALPEAHMML